MLKKLTIAYVFAAVIGVNRCGGDAEPASDFSAKAEGGRAAEAVVGEVFRIAVAIGKGMPSPACIELRLLGEARAVSCRDDFGGVFRISFVPKIGDYVLLRPPPNYMDPGAAWENEVPAGGMLDADEDADNQDPRITIEVVASQAEPGEGGHLRPADQWRKAEIRTRLRCRECTW